MAEIIQLGDLDDEEGKFHQFLDELKVGNKRAIFLLTGVDGTVKLGCTAKAPAELIVMLHHLKKFNEYMVDTYSADLFDIEEEEDE